MPYRLLIPCCCILVLAACQPTDDPQYIIDRAIEAHGGAVIDHSEIAFDYRGKHFKALRDGGRFSYERIYTDSTGDVHEVLNNDEVFKMVNGERVELEEKKRYSIQETLNSVVYFGLVPYFLNDPPVIKKYLGTDSVEGAPYHMVEITFMQEGGGPDYEDRFIFWFHQDQFTMDYLAYDFHINDGGTRFRKAFNVRTINGIRFADFFNFASDALPQPGTPIETYPRLLEADSLNLLSEIIWENVTVH